jgi:hypothetical protein
MTNVSTYSDIELQQRLGAAIIDRDVKTETLLKQEQDRRTLQPLADAERARRETALREKEAEALTQKLVALRDALREQFVNELAVLAVTPQTEASLLLCFACRLDELDDVTQLRIDKVDEFCHVLVVELRALRLLRVLGNRSEAHIDRVLRISCACVHEGRVHRTLREGQHHHDTVMPILHKCIVADFSNKTVCDTGENCRSLRGSVAC